MTRWGGRAAREWTAAVLDRYGRVCLLNLPGCTRVATTGDHVIPKSVRPDLAFDVTNGRPACRACNSRRGRRPLSRVAVVDHVEFFESAFGPRSPSRPISPPDEGKTSEGARP